MVFGEWGDIRRLRGYVQYLEATAMGRASCWLQMLMLKVAFGGYGGFRRLGCYLEERCNLWKPGRRPLEAKAIVCS